MSRRKPTTKTEPLSFLARLKQHHVYRVAVGYGAAIAVAIQVVARAFPYVGWAAAVPAVIIILAASLPLAMVLAWLLVSPHLGVFDLQRTNQIGQLWRPFWAMVLAGPLAAWLRGVLLRNAPILPIFVLVLGGISALALLVWRFLFWLVVHER